MSVDFADYVTLWGTGCERGYHYAEIVSEIKALYAHCLATVLSTGVESEMIKAMDDKQVE